MMNIIKLNDNFSVSPQISTQDLYLIAGRGYKSVINNRPDGEEDGQVKSDDIKAKCHELGLQYTHLPVISGNIKPAEVAQFNKLLQSQPEPIFAFCRTGTRSSMLWVISSDDRNTKETRWRCADKNGFKFDLNLNV